NQQMTETYQEQHQQNQHYRESNSGQKQFEPVEYSQIPSYVDNMETTNNEYEQKNSMQYHEQKQQDQKVEQDLPPQQPNNSKIKPKIDINKKPETLAEFEALEQYKKTDEYKQLMSQ